MITKDDKKEITVLLVVSTEGVLLTPLVIYRGETPGCHAKIIFAYGWYITHSCNPYFAATQRDLGLPDDHVCRFSSFKHFAAHCCD